MTALKTTAKALFKKVHSYPGIVTVTVIKKMYPRFRASEKSHWEMLILKLLGRNAKADKPPAYPTLREAFDAVTSRLSKMGIYSTKTNTFGGLSVSYSHRGGALGTIGYNRMNDKYYVSFGRYGAPTYVNSLEIATQTFLTNTSGLWKAA